jgi:hypothetical protein
MQCEPCCQADERTSREGGPVAGRGATNEPQAISGGVGCPRVMQRARSIALSAPRRAEVSRTRADTPKRGTSGHAADRKSGQAAVCRGIPNWDRAATVPAECAVSSEWREAPLGQELRDLVVSQLRGVGVVIGEQVG